jgi:hypothetical protein
MMWNQIARLARTVKDRIRVLLWPRGLFNLRLWCGKNAEFRTEPERKLADPAP